MNAVDAPGFWVRLESVWAQRGDEYSLPVPGEDTRRVADTMPTVVTVEVSDGVDPELWAAERVWILHKQPVPDVGAGGLPTDWPKRPTRCNQCGPDSCPAFDSALQTMLRYGSAPGAVTDTGLSAVA